MENQREIWESKERIERFWVLFFFVFIIYLEYSFPLYEFWSFNTCIRMYEYTYFLECWYYEIMPAMMGFSDLFGPFFSFTAYCYLYFIFLIWRLIYWSLKYSWEYFLQLPKIFFFCKYVIFCFLINEV
jgi:hypothetical protein